MKLIELEGTPYEVGFQFGNKCRAEIQRVLDKQYKVLGVPDIISKKDTLEVANKFWPYVKEYSPEIVDEITGMAEGADVLKDEIFLLNAWTEMMWDLKPKDYSGSGCTSYAVTGTATSTGETVGGQSDDTVVEFKEDYFVVKVKPEKGPKFIGPTRAGSIPCAYYGMNSDGLCVLANLLESPTMQLGVPSNFMKRKALMQSNLDDARDWIIKATRVSAQNYLIFDKKGGIINIETTPEKYVILNAKDDIMCHTNHFVSPELENQEAIDFLSNCKSRYDRMTELLKQKHGSINIKDLMKFAGDHGKYPDSICTHIEDSPQHGLGTVVVLLFEPNKSKLWVSTGTPCNNPYEEYNL